MFFENYPTPPGSEGGKWFTVKELKDMVEALISKQKKTRKRKHKTTTTTTTTTITTTTTSTTSTYY